MDRRTFLKLLPATPLAIASFKDYPDPGLHITPSTFQSYPAKAKRKLTYALRQLGLDIKQVVNVRREPMMKAYLIDIRHLIDGKSHLSCWTTDPYSEVRGSGGERGICLYTYTITDELLSNWERKFLLSRFV